MQMSRLLCWLVCTRDDSQAMRPLVTRWLIVPMVSITHRPLRGSKGRCPSRMHPEQISSVELNANRVAFGQLRFIEMNWRGISDPPDVWDILSFRQTVSRQQRCAFCAFCFREGVCWHSLGCPCHVCGVHERTCE